MAGNQSRDWVVVWEASRHGADIEADMIVSVLEGSAIPVVRLPASSAPVVFDGFGGPMLPVKVLVPPDREADAKELLADAETEPTGPAEE
jgi:hypothetical protein